MKLCKNTNPLGSLCKDCKFSEEQFFLLRCIRPTFVSPVDGCYQPRNAYCSNERYDGWLNARIFDSCGKEGRYFETKENVID